MTQINSAIGGAWLKGKRNISATSSLVLDTRALAGFTSLDFVITARNAAKTVTKSLYYSVLMENGTPKSVIMNRKGSLQMGVTEAVVGSMLEVTVENKESFDINVEFARLVLK